MYNLHGKNYIFTLQPTCHPIVPLACFAVASKTKKNILITLKVATPPGLEAMQTLSPHTYWLSQCCKHVQPAGKCNAAISLRTAKAQHLAHQLPAH